MLFLFKQNIPTIVPYPAFSAEVDAIALRAAVKGIETNNEEIIRVLGSRSFSQRYEIEQIYKLLFNRDLISDLKRDLSGNFERLAVSLFVPWPQHAATSIQKAFCDNLGPDEKTIIDLIVTSNKCELMEIKISYHKRKMNIISKVT